MEHPDLIILQETKVEEGTILSMGKDNWKKKEGIVMSARGASGGLATLWTEKIFEVHNSFATQHWIFTELTHLPSNLRFSLFNIYVLVLYREKRECWNTMADFLEI